MTTIKSDIQKMVDNIQSGDTQELLTILTTNILQLQLFNGSVTHNLMGDLGQEVLVYAMMSIFLEQI